MLGKREASPRRRARHVEAGGELTARPRRRGRAHSPSSALGGRAAGREGLADERKVVHEQAREDERPAGGEQGADLGGPVDEQEGHQVREDEVERAGAQAPPAVGANDPQPGAVERARGGVDDAGGLRVDVGGDDRSGAEAPGGDGEQGRAGAEVERPAQRPAGGQVLERAEAEPRRLVGAGAEGPPGIDDQHVGGRPDGASQARRDDEAPHAKGPEALAEARDPVHVRHLGGLDGGARRREAPAVSGGASSAK